MDAAHHRMGGELSQFVLPLLPRLTTMAMRHQERRMSIFGMPSTVVTERSQPYLFTGLNLNKDGPWERAQRKSWTFSQMSCRMLFVSQEPQSGASHTRTHGRVRSYPTGARSGPPTG